MFSRAGAGSRKKKFPEPPQNRTAPKPCLWGPSANQMLVTWPTWRARGDEPSWPAGPGPRAGCAPTQSPPPPPGLCRRRGRRQGPAGIPASRSPAGGRPAPPSPCSAGGGRQHTFTVNFKWLNTVFIVADRLYGRVPSSRLQYIHNQCCGAGPCSAFFCPRPRLLKSLWLWLSAPVLLIRIRRIPIISLDPDPYQKLAGSGSVSKVG